MIKNTKYRVTGEIPIFLENINSLLERYFTKTKLNFLSLDTEGFDYEILENIDFNFVQPEVILVETVNCSKEGCGKKRFEIIELMHKRNYAVFADTYINTIFINWDFASKLKATPFCIVNPSKLNR